MEISASRCKIPIMRWSMASSCMVMQFYSAVVHMIVDSAACRQ
ncbi:Uncharacterised protein [Bordetella pertussis]|nr:Uncharacterised protein [Bordetella pertussis]